MLYQSQKILIKLSVFFHNLLYYCKRHFYTLCETKTDQLIETELRMILISDLSILDFFFPPQFNLYFSICHMTAALSFSLPVAEINFSYSV